MRFAQCAYLQHVGRHCSTSYLVYRSMLPQRPTPLELGPTNELCASSYFADA